jgi:hypothetical protein
MKDFANIFLGHFCLGLNFMQGLPEDWKTTSEGMAFVLNP